MVKETDRVGYSPNGKYGLYDTKDNCWVGNTDGPLRYDDEEFARMAATVVTEMTRWEYGRIRVREYDGTGVQKKDEFETPRTLSEAVRIAEGERPHITRIK